MATKLMAACVLFTIACCLAVLDNNRDTSWIVISVSDQ